MSVVHGKIGKLSLAEYLIEFFFQVEGTIRGTVILPASLPLRGSLWGMELFP